MLGSTNYSNFHNQGTQFKRQNVSGFEAPKWHAGCRSTACSRRLLLSHGAAAVVQTPPKCSCWRLAHGWYHLLAMPTSPHTWPSRPNPYFKKEPMMKSTGWTGKLSSKVRNRNLKKLTQNLTIQSCLIPLGLWSRNHEIVLAQNWGARRPTHQRSKFGSQSCTKSRVPRVRLRDRARHVHVSFKGILAGQTCEHSFC